MCFPATTKTSVPRRAMVLLGPLYSVWSEPLRVWCVELCADLGVLKSWNPGEGLDNQLGVWLMVFGIVFSQGCVLELGDRSANSHKKAVHIFLICLQDMKAKSTLPSKSRREARRAFASRLSFRPCLSSNIPSCKHKVIMPAIVQPTVERLDKPSAYYLGRVGTSLSRWFDSYTGSLPG